MDERRERKKDEKHVSYDLGDCSELEINQNKLDKINDIKKLCRHTKNLPVHRILSGDISSFNDPSDDNYHRTLIIGKVDDRHSIQAIPRQLKESGVLVQSKCLWTTKKERKRTDLRFSSLDREEVLGNSNHDFDLQKRKQFSKSPSESITAFNVSQKEQVACRESKLESCKMTKSFRKSVEFINEEERELLANYRLVAELFEKSLVKREANKNDTTKCRVDEGAKKNRTARENSKRKLNRSATIGAETRIFDKESTKIFAKQTCIQQNFCPKGLQWKTSLVHVNTLAGNGDDGSLNDEGGKDSTRGDASLNKSDELKTERDYNKGSKEYISSDASAQLAANFTLLDHSEPSTFEFQMRTKNKGNKCSDKCESLIDYDNYKASLYNIPSSSSSYTKQESTYLDRFDATSGTSKVKLTKSSTSSSNQSPSLRISIDNLRMIVEQNLVATLVGVYILISLTVIMILTLPYLFNIQRETIENSVSKDILKAVSFEQIQKINDQALDIDSVGLKPTKVSNIKKEITKVTTNQDSTTLLVHRVEINKGTLSKSKQQVVTGNNLEESYEAVRGGEDIIPSIDKQSVIEQVYKNKQQYQDRSQTTRKRGTRVGQTKGGGDESKTTTSQVQATKVIKDKFNGWWNVAHNQICQPLKVPFCNKSFGSIFPQANSNNQQHQSSLFEPIGTLLPYDKTLLPNQFSSSRQSQVERVLQRYEPIIDIKCYTLMPLFLCSIYAPKCIRLDQSQVDRHFISKSFFTDSEIDQEDSEGLYFANQLAMSIKRPTQTAHLFNKQDLKPSNWSRLVPPCKSLCKGEFDKQNVILSPFLRKLTH